jgi:twitching motility protein PilI
MTERLSLRDFQQNLSDRLAIAQRGETGLSLLGVESGDESLPGGGYWLLDLTDSGEVIPVPALAPAPLTQPWFAGLANIRGTLYGVTDFSAWRGGEPTPRNAQARLLLIGARHGNNCALLVNRALGLHPRHLLNADDTTASTTSDAGWLGGRFRDAQGVLWTQLRIPPLLADASYLNVAA